MMLSMLQVREGKQILGDIEKLKEAPTTTNVDQVVGLGLQRKKEYAVGDIAYTTGLPLSLCLECVTQGTTGSESPDFSDKKAGDTLEDGTAVFVINKKSNATAEQLTTARTIDGVNFNGTGNIVHYGSCSTAAATAEKAVACAGFVLAAGAKIAVKFTVTNTAANPTLNVQSTGAKPVYYRGEAISAGYLAANSTYEFVYNGTQYELIGDLDASKISGKTICVVSSFDASTGTLNLTGLS